MSKLIKLVEEHNVCSLPWLQAEINFQSGEVKPCCRYIGELGNISDGLKTIWLNDITKTLRERMINLERINECRLCDNEVGSSYRDYKNKQYTLLTSDIDYSEENLPKIIHVIISDICNLGCRMCSPSLSSTLNTLISSSKTLQNFYPIHNPSLNCSPVDSLNGSLSNLSGLNISGGEPLVAKDIIPLIQRVNAEATKLKRINIITNMSKLNKPLLEELNSITDSVILNFTISIDGPKTIHEYIRYNCSFDKMIDNIRYIKDNYPRITFDSNSTISILNVGYIVDTLRSYQHIEDITGIKFKNIICSEVNHPCHLKASIIPKELKKMYLEKIMKEITPELFNISGGRILYNNAIQLLNETDDRNEYDNFIRFINEFDKVANTNFINTYPEFKNFID
jgi:sulfatase maturation enzyme AslB (radical SAM superfamily)